MYLELKLVQDANLIIKEKIQVEIEPLDLIDIKFSNVYQYFTELACFETQASFSAISTFVDGYHYFGSIYGFGERTIDYNSTFLNIEMHCSESILDNETFVLPFEKTPFKTMHLFGEKMLENTHSVFGVVLKFNDKPIGMYCVGGSEVMDKSKVFQKLSDFAKQMLTYILTVKENKYLLTASDK